MSRQLLLKGVEDRWWHLLDTDWITGFRERTNTTSTITYDDGTGPASEYQVMIAADDLAAQIHAAVTSAVWHDPLILKLNIVPAKWVAVVPETIKEFSEAFGYSTRVELRDGSIYDVAVEPKEFAKLLQEALLFGDAHAQVQPIPVNNDTDTTAAAADATAEMVKGLEITNAELRSYNGTLERESSALHVRLDDAEKSIDILRNERDKALEARRAATGETYNYRQTVRQLRDDLTALAQERDDLSIKATGIENALTSHIASTHALRQQIKRNEADNIALRAEIGSITNELHTAQGAFDQMHAAAAATLRHDHAGQTYEELLTAQLEEARGDRDAWADKAVARGLALDDANASIERNKALFERRIAAYNETIGEVRDKLREVQED